MLSISKSAGAALIGVIVTMPMFIIAFFHGASSGTILLFPYSSLLLLFLSSDTPFFQLLFGLSLLGQFPVYTVCLIRALDKKQLINVALVLLLVHAVAMIFCFLISMKEPLLYRLD